MFNGGFEGDSSLQMSFSDNSGETKTGVRAGLWESKAGLELGLIPQVEATYN